jgi:hypothetical protein
MSKEFTMADYAPGTRGVSNRSTDLLGRSRLLPPGCALRFPEGTLEGPADFWDLDSTLYDTAHRHHVIDEIKAGSKTWDDYSRMCSGDTVLPGSRALMQARSGQAIQVVITGRAESARELTVANFRRDEVPADLLIMRPDGDETHNGEYKVACIRELVARGIIPQLVFEDWAPAARLLAAELDVPVVGINPFYEDSPQGGI